MKKSLIAIVVILSVILASCGGSGDDQKSKTKEDSIKKADSITNIVVGKWKQEGKNIYLTIVKSGDLYTVTENDVTYAYNLEGQMLTSVDGTGPTYSLIGDGELLKGSTKYTKSDDSKSDKEVAEDKTSDSKKSKDSKASKKTTKTTTTTTTDETEVAETIPLELTIVCDNTINLFQNPRSGAAVVKGLSNGSVCTIISKGSTLSTFGGKKDYWYNVKVEGFKGWVFGAYTSLKE
jgi:hypothetical protein